MHRNKANLVTLLLAMLTACGGGGGGASTAVDTAIVSGTVLDGYLKNATVFLDKNDNGVYDVGEPKATTDSNGAYSFSASTIDINSHSVVALAVPGVTVDMDNPASTVNQQFSLTTPAGKNSIISPITTLVAVKINAGLTPAAAEAAVLTDLGMAGVDVYKDYVSAKKIDPSYIQMHNLAVATTEVLKAVEATNNASISLSQRLTSVDTSFKNVIANQVSTIKLATSQTTAAEMASAAIMTSVNNKNSIVYKTVITFPASDGNTYNNVNYAFGNFGSFTNCFVAVSADAIDKFAQDPPVNFVCEQTDGTYKNVTQDLLGQTLNVNATYPLVADFNNDGKDDVFLIRSWDGVDTGNGSLKTDDAYALISKGNGYTVNRLSGFNTIDAAPWMRQFSAADINQDGCLDVVNAVVFLGDCHGNFTFDLVREVVNNWPAHYNYTGTGSCSGNFLNNGNRQYVMTDTYSGYANGQPNVVLEIDSKLKISNTAVLPKPYWNIYYKASDAAHNYLCRTADINGDGLDDIVIVTRVWSKYTNNQWSAYSYYQIYINKGNLVFEDASETFMPNQITAIGSSSNIRFIDVNGDNKVDMLLDGPDNGSQVYLNSGTKFNKYFVKNELDTLRHDSTYGVMPVKGSEGWNYIVPYKKNGVMYIDIAMTKYKFN